MARAVVRDPVAKSGLEDGLFRDEGRKGKTEMRAVFWVDHLATGGMQNTSLNLARALVARGHHVVYASDRGPMEQILHDYRLEHRWVPYEGLRRPAPRTLKALAGILDELQPDVVHTFSNWCSLEALLAATVFRGIPVYPHHLATKLPAFRFPRSIRSAAICPWFRDVMVSRGHAAGTVDVVAPRIDLRRHRPLAPDPDLRTDLGLPEDLPVVLSISRLHPDKMPGLRQTLEAIEILHASGGPSCTLLVVGDGPCREELARRAERINTHCSPSRVILAGEMLDTPRLFALAEVAAVMASTAMRAVACGVPTILVGRNGFAGIVEPSSVGRIAYHNFCGTDVTEPRDPGLLAAALQDLLEDESRREDLRVWGRAYALSSLDADLGAARLESIYAQLTAAPPSLRLRAGILGQVALAMGHIYLSKITRTLRPSLPVS